MFLQLGFKKFTALAVNFNQNVLQFTFSKT